MSEENKALFRRFVDEVLNPGEYDRMEEFVAPEFMNYIVGPHGEPAVTFRGPEGYRQGHLGFRAAYPDFHIKIEDIIAEGDLIAIHMIWSGTHLGEWRGISPTGTKVAWGSTLFRRIANGMFVEGWGVTAIHRELQALGVDLSQYGL